MLHFAWYYIAAAHLFPFPASAEPQKHKGTALGMSGTTEDNHCPLTQEPCPTA